MLKSVKAFVEFLRIKKKKFVLKICRSGKFKEKSACNDSEAVSHIDPTIN